MKIVDLITSEIVTDCLSDIIKTKFQVDSNNFGGVKFEADLAQSLRNSGHYVYTQREVETLIDNGVTFEFGVTFSDFKRNQKDINSTVYASDLFLFEKINDVLNFVDSVSMKTSINDNDGSKIFIANDAEGVVYDRLISDEAEFSLGQVLMVSLNTQTGKFSVDYFDGEVIDLVGLFKDSKVTNEKVSFNLSESVFGGKSREVLTVINRNAVTGKKSTSFSRGVQVRRDFIPNLVGAGVMESVVIGSISVDMSSLVDSLLVIG